MNRATKDLAIAFLGLIATILFLTPILAIYKHSDGATLVVIVLVQWILSRKLWEQQYDTKKTLLLWLLMSVLLIIAVILRDYAVVYFGKEEWHHSTKYYISVGSASTFWWAMVESVRHKTKKKNSDGQPQQD